MSENELLEDISGWQKSYSTLKLECKVLRSHISELEATCEGLDNLSAKTVDQNQRLEAKLSALVEAAEIYFAPAITLADHIDAKIKLKAAIAAANDRGRHGD